MLKVNTFNFTLWLVHSDSTVAVGHKLKLNHIIDDSYYNYNNNYHYQYHFKFMYLKAK